MPTIGLGEDTGIEDHDVAAVALAADESPDALTEPYHRIGDGDIGKGVAALHAAVFAARLADGVAGVFKGEASNDDLREGGAGEVDPRPETIGAEEDAVACFGKATSEFRASVVEALREKGAVDFFKEIGVAFADLAKVEMTGEKDKGAACNATAAPCNHIGEVIEVEATGAGLREGRVFRNKQAGVVGVIKGGGFHLCLRGFRADFALKTVELLSVGKGGAGEDGGGVAAEEGLAQGGRDVEGGAAQGDDLAFLPAAFEPMDMAFLSKGDESTDRIAIPEEAFAVVAEFILLAFVVGFLDAGGEAFGDGFEGPAQDVLAKFRFVDTADGILGEEGIVQVAEEFMIGGEGFLDRGKVVMIAFFFKGAAFVAGIIETFEGAIDGVVAKVDAEVIGGDGGDAVGFVEDDKIVG